MISRGKENNITLLDIISKTSESEILYHYLDVTELPCVIRSPFREDKRPSFGLYEINGHVRYRDYSTGEQGSIYNILCQLWSCDYQQALNRIYYDVVYNNYTNGAKIIPTSHVKILKASDTQLDVKVRDWRDYDLEYWSSYGITLQWLQWADIYPISHIIITKKGTPATFPADKLAYCFVEYKEGNTTLKIYQPLNTNGHKWYNKHDRSVISLWTKIPAKGERVVICSSMKDALCLSANTGIPALAIQGEAYNISETAINELKRRFTKQYIILDNDEAGKKDAFKLSLSTGFINLELPIFNGGKDLSDYYKLFGKETFRQMIKNLFNYD